jgi:hypothetical protein
MTLVSDIIQDSYREGNLISITAVPTAAELKEGLTLFNRYIASLVGDDAGEQLETILIGRNNVARPLGYPWYDQIPYQTDWYVPANVRMALNLTSPQTVSLDPNPEDGQRFAFMDLSNDLATSPFTILGNGRTIAGAISQTYSTNGTNMQFMYRKDLGNWVIMSPLLATDLFPFPSDFEHMFVMAGAIWLNPRHGQVTDVGTSASYARQLRQFQARYRQHIQMGSEPALVRTVGERHQRYGGYDVNRAQAAFNSGYPFSSR